MPIAAKGHQLFEAELRKQHDAMRRAGLDANGTDGARELLKRTMLVLRASKYPGLVKEFEKTEKAVEEQIKRAEAPQEEEDGSAKSGA